MAKSKAQHDDQGLPPSEAARAYKRDRKTGGRAAAALLEARRTPKGPSDH